MTPADALGSGFYPPDDSRGRMTLVILRADDLAAVALEAKENVVVNCGSGVATSFNDVIRILNDAMGVRRTPEYIDNPIAATYQDHTECDMSLAKAKLGFVPAFSIEKGIADYIRESV